TTQRRPGPTQPCGERALVARSATLEVGGIEVHGGVDRDGWFEVSPYQWVDAYRAGAPPASEVTARVDAVGGSRTITAVLDPGQLAAHAGQFLAHADFDAEIRPLERVPGLVAGPVRASLTTGAGGNAVRIVLPIRNDGPGDAWSVRGQITAPAVPAIDGRILYVGKLARGAHVVRELVIPVMDRASSALRGEPIELSIELRDAHGTAPATPAAFRGILLGELPGAR
ncbi:MAG TPA: hypothetical protein VFT22_40520, partial [Kofleriaceae bacterium]|nr:hypothetical protein [Kofleriaceae bacterium]